MDNTNQGDDAQAPRPRRKTILEKMQEDIHRHLGPMRQIQVFQDLARQYSSESQALAFLKRIEPERQLQEMLERTAIPKHVQEMLDQTSVAAQAKRMLEPYLPKYPQAQQVDILRIATELNSASEVNKAYEKYFKPVTAQQEWLKQLQRQALGGAAIQNLVRQFEQTNLAFVAMDAAKKSMDVLWGSFRNINLSAYEASEEVKREAAAAAQLITQAASAEPTLKEAVDQIIFAIQAEQKPAVQLMLFLFFRKLLDWLIAGAIGTAMAYYAPPLLNESPQATTKAVKEKAREAVGVPELLVDYRYIAAKVLIVRQNPRARSPAVGQLTFGKLVKLVKKEKDFTLVLWTDKESGTELQGWVFSRYLGSFVAAE